MILHFASLSFKRIDRFPEFIAESKRGVAEIAERSAEGNLVFFISAPLHSPLRLVMYVTSKGVGLKTKQARTVSDPRLRLHIFPPKDLVRLCWRQNRLPPGDRSCLEQSCARQDMLERFSVHRSALSPFVGCKMNLRLKLWKLLRVPFSAIWSQNRP